MPRWEAVLLVRERHLFTLPGIEVGFPFGAPMLIINAQVFKEAMDPAST